MNVSSTTLAKLDFPRVKAALAERAASALGVELAEALSPDLPREAAQLSWQRIAEARSGSDLSLGGVHDIRPLTQRVIDGAVLEGPEILEMAYTLDAAMSIKRSILLSERQALSELAVQIGSFDGSLRQVREQLDVDGRVRDDATPKLRDIRRRLHPLRGRIRERLHELLSRYSDYVQDAIITLRRDRYVIPIRAASQAHVPGIVLDTSDSGATVFTEPQSVVPLNNELALLEFEERDEVRRILSALGQKLAFEPELEDTLRVLAELDLIAASARLAEDWQMQAPEFTEDGTLQLLGARHPLIKHCVPNSVTLDEAQRLLIVTGPNAGGKTVLLKTLGLAVVMAHCGLFVATAQKARLPNFQALLSDIGDEQSIEASLSTYAGHLKNLKAISEGAAPDVLVLIDELGSGTDPDEGAALSQAVLEKLLASGARGIINTHLAPLKVFASETAGVQNAAMSFDVEKLAPRFEMVVGQPGRSYALAIAERLGLSQGLLARAKEILGPEGTALEGLLQTLERQRDELQEKQLELEVERRRALQEARLLREQIDTLRARESEVLASAAAKADELVQDTLQRAKELKKTASSGGAERSQALSELQQLRQEIKGKAGPVYKARKPQAQGKKGLEPGTVVFVESYGASGPISEVRGNEVVVQLGLLKVSVPKTAVRLEKAKKPKQAAGYSAPTRFDEELNIRAERVEGALEKVRDFITEAHALKQRRVRILHGKGTGTLRDAVRNLLKNDKRVESFEDAVPYEGGHGVTVAYLRLTR